MDVDQTVNRLAVVGVMIKLFAVVAAVDSLVVDKRLIHLKPAAAN